MRYVRAVSAAIALVVMYGTSIAANAPEKTAQHCAPGAHQQDGSSFRPYTDLKTFMEHVITPTAIVIWRTNGAIEDASGVRDLSPKTDEDWDDVVTATATLLESTNALRIPARALDDEWEVYVQKLSVLAERAYGAAERHDLAAISNVSDELYSVCLGCHEHYGVR